MSKKSFTGGLNSLLGGVTEEPKEIIRVEPKKEVVKKTIQPIVEEKIEPTIQYEKQNSNSTRIISSTSQLGTKENETRATFIVNEVLLEKIKAIAYWERESIKDVLNNALEGAIKKYETKNGPINPIPKKK